MEASLVVWGIVSRAFAKARALQLVLLAVAAFAVACQSSESDDELLARVQQGVMNGEPCSGPPNCLSNNCVDGVCCDTPCGGGDPTDCQACSMAAGGVTNGVCGQRNGSCSDNNACTTNDTCMGTTCMGGTQVNCNGGGTCEPLSGTCNCSPGHAGPNCEYSDQYTCNYGGQAQPNGTCNCNFGYAGSNCQYSNQTTCNSHGVVDANGFCTCNYGWAPPNCATTDPALCNYHGWTSTPGFPCTCDPGWAGNTCQYGDSTTCNGWGTVDGSGACTCNAPYAGPTCTEYSDIYTCNNAGRAQNDGTCVCNPGYAGSSCQYSNMGTCGGNGTVDNFGYCTCTIGFAGPNCQYGDSTTCFGHGTAQFNGTCTCNPGFGGPSCAECASGYYNYPSCISCNPANCPAAPACQVATCNQFGQCANVPAAPGTICNDGNAATTNDQCNGSGTCVGTNLCATVTCNAATQCASAGTCNPQTGQCAYTYASTVTTCDDFNPATINDKCNGAGACVGTADPCYNVTCNPATACMNAGTCSNGTCTYAPKSNTTPCDDADPTTGNDKCNGAGACVGTSYCAGVTCNPPTQCTSAGTCAPTTGICQYTQYGTATSCNDDNPATIDDKCNGAGACVGTLDPCYNVTCNSATQCMNAGTCANGTCTYTPKPGTTTCDDANANTVNDTCNGAGVCVGVDLCATVTCTAQSQCHVAGACNPQTGACSNPFKANNSPCADGNPNTVDDKCQNGVCIGTNLCAGVTCTALDQCHDVGTCDPASGICSNPNKLDNTTCTDGNANTVNDKCVGGTCTGTNLCAGVVCTALDQCHDPGTCSFATGQCSNPPKGDGAGCNDGNANTINDVCTGGSCAGTNPCAGVVCTALDACHVAGTCTQGTGVCTNPNAPNDTACDDGNASTANDRCNNGLCNGVNLCAGVTCQPLDGCHLAGSCNPSTGTCSNPVAPENTQCDDANPVTVNDRCTAGVCGGTDLCSGVVCTALDACHVAGVCSAATGICSNPTAAENTPCNDGNACTQGDSCKSGTCTGGGAVSCPAGNECQTPTCDPATGCAFASKSPGTACTDDGQICTADYCDGAGACTHPAGNPGTFCRAAVCLGTSVQPAGQCDGATAACPAATTSSCGGFGCANGACLLTCATSAQCATGSYCSAGTCNPQKTVGAACTATAECESGNCVDGVCCNDACSGTCQACSAAKKGSGADGTCGVIADGSDPDTECAGATCASGAFESGHTCNGAGACRAISTAPCAPFKCSGAACATTCTVDGDCATGATCAAGVCTGKVSNGVACTTTDQCQSGNCVDGVCCDTACTTKCQACTAARTGLATDGTCGNVKDGTDPRNECGGATCTGQTLSEQVCDGSGACRAITTACAPAKCDAAGLACAGGCTTDGDCATGAYCASGACKAKHGDGNACGGANHCLSDHCVDGVCCDTSCEGTCVACSAAKKGSGSDGNCGRIADGTDPDAECPGQTCKDGVQENGHTCDGVGACRPVATAPCSPFACTTAGTACATTCVADVECGKGFHCASGACVVGNGVGTACTAATQCDTGFCVDGICCDKACDGACEGCSAAEKGAGADGVCGPVQTGTCGFVPAPDAGIPEPPPPGQPPVIEGEFQRCSTASECKTGFCVDGVCCDTACNDKCHSCALATSPGKCTASPIGVDLRAECGPKGSCLGTCDGQGTCMGATRGTQCQPNRCISATKGIGAAYCTAPGSVCPVESVAEFDCAPYVCDPTFKGCVKQCTGTADCANGFVCDTESKQCIVPVAVEDTGCTTGTRSRGSSFGAVLVAMSALLLARRSRRRALATIAVLTLAFGLFGCGNRAEVEPAATDAGITTAAFVRRGDAFVSRASLGGVAVRFDALGTEVDGVGFATKSIGATQAVAALPKVDGARVEYARGPGLREWFVHEARGLEQGFTILHSEADLRIVVAVHGLRPLDRDGVIHLVDAHDTPVLAYGELSARDAKGRALASSMRVEGTSIVLAIDARDAAFPITVDPLIWSLQSRIVAADGQSGDRLGDDVAIDGDTLVAGASGKSAAYVALRTATAWAQQAKLVPGDGAATDLFGRSVAISADTIVVGAPGAAGGGAAYVFVRSGTAWTQQAKLVSADLAAGDELGSAIAIRGDVVVIGARGAASAQGTAYAFVRSGTTWAQEAKLAAADGAAGATFGDAVALGDGFAVVGASGRAAKRGAAYVFARTGVTWAQQSMLLASDGAAGDELGLSVDVGGDSALVGAPGKTVGTNAGQGAAYVFVRATEWSQQSKLVHEGGVASARFGRSVAVSGDRAVVGAEAGRVGTLTAGSAHVFARTGSAWAVSQTLSVSDGASGEGFGGAAAASADTLVVGAANKQIGANATQGAAFAFTFGKGNGDACAAASECATRHCVDSVCCDTPCDGVCVACAAAKNGSGVDGNCRAIAAATDPDSECPGSTCKEGVLENGHECNGAGACRAKATTPCTPFACDAAGTACATACATDDACAKTHHCVAGACVAGDALGAVCSRGRQCGSGFCVDGVCCEKACEGACEACSAAEKKRGLDGYCDHIWEGACGDAGTSVYPEDSGVDVAAPEPQKAIVIGESFNRCSKPSDCPTGFCVEGLCCDSACNERCHSCALATSPGKCVPTPAGVDFRAECGPANACVGTCDGKGGCVGAQKGTLCEPNRCVGASKAVGAAVCLAAGVACPLESVAQIDCAPYVCEPAFGVCAGDCRTSADCVSGFACDTPTRKCIAPPVAEEESACSLGATPSPSRSSAWVSVVLAAVAISLRRARALRRR